MHLGIIMDGNRRWAKKRLLPSFAGHKAGFSKVEHIVEYIAQNTEITHLTLWALSKENLVKRSQEEIEGLFSLLEKFIDFIPKFQANNAKFETIGDIGRLPQKLQDVLQDMKDATKDNTGPVVIIALVYSGQDEIIRAIQKLSLSDRETLDEKSFRSFLDTSKFPPIDLIIRTGGENRHSGFLLYDSAYSEYYFSEKMWPEFETQDLDMALEYFSKTERRFGK